MHFPVAIIAIGRNEGQRLRACLAAAVSHDNAIVIYVDSGSTDASITLAESFNAHVVKLDLSIPFTAARARNEGFAKAISVAPAIQYIQFIDGDCELQPDWISQAVKTLTDKPQAAVVCGRRRERFPKASIYNTLCDIEWATPVGEVKACGGDMMIRREAFEGVCGYNPDIIAGEEPEMCVRLRHAGWVILRIDAEMTWHDAAMTHFSQWWKRNIRAGHAYAEGFDRHGQPPELFRAKEVKSNRIWGILWLIPFAWPLHILLAAKVAHYRYHNSKTPFKASVLYGFFVALSKLPQMLGQRKYIHNKTAGKHQTIIEYKTHS
jgi:GT2 family glycosyltransferase